VREDSIILVGLVRKKQAEKRRKIRRKDPRFRQPVFDTNSYKA